jgi:hypothetical protein
MIGVDLVVPASFRIEHATPPKGWTATIAGQQVHYRGAGIATGGFALFSVRGTATVRGKLRFPVTTRAADGTAREWNDVPGQGVRPPPIMFAGVDPTVTSTSGSSLAQWVGLALVAGGVVALAGWWLRRRRLVEVVDEGGSGAGDA